MRYQVVRLGWPGMCVCGVGSAKTSTLVDHFVSSPRERQKRDRRESRGDERRGTGKKEEQE